MKGIKLFLYTLLIAFITSAIWATHTIEWPLFPNGTSPVIITAAVGYLGGAILLVWAIAWIFDNWKDL